MSILEAVVHYLCHTIHYFTIVNAEHNIILSCFKYITPTSVPVKNNNYVVNLHKYLNLFS